MTALGIDVEPRVISPKTGDRIRLVDAVENFLSRSSHGVIRLTGNGLEVLAAIERLCVYFGPLVCNGRNWDPTRIAVVGNQQIVLVSKMTTARVDLTLHLAKWDDDDLIHYLLAHHPQSCGSVLERVRSSSRFWRPETSTGWRFALSVLAQDPWCPGLRRAIESVLDSQVGADAGDEELVGPDKAPVNVFEFNLTPRADLETPPKFARRILADATYRRCQALRFFTRCLQERRLPENFREVVSSEYLDELAKVLVEAKVDCDFLREPLNFNLMFQPAVASLLARLDPAWRPTAGWVHFAGADFNGVEWPGLVLAWPGLSLLPLHSCKLNRAKLQDGRLKHLGFQSALLIEANLSRAVIEECELSKADLTKAKLCEAVLRLVNGPGIRLQNADLGGALLETVNFTDADLTAANFESATLAQVVMNQAPLGQANFAYASLRRCAAKGCDFRSARLDHASFLGCILERCNWEKIEAVDLCFRNSNLQHCWFTGSVLQNASFQGADLRNAGLGDVEWEGADLRGADFRNVAFHFGSSRSGIVDSPYPSHGTRTGFYTDDYFDQPFKSPEEIRSANLRGADLRDAKLDGADFYLVDLRDAKIDEGDLPYLRKCGAILTSRC